MIGLLKKDLFLLWHAYRKNLALVLVLYTGFAFATGNSFWVILFSWVFGFYVIGGLTMDNSSKWDLYACSLPVRKDQIVGTKFILIFLSLLSSFLLSTLVCVILFFTQQKPLAQMLASSFFTACICLVYFGIMLALSYKFGPEKARGSMLLVIVALAAIVMLAAKLGLFDFLENSKTLASWLQSDSLPLVLGIGTPVVCAVIYLLCWAIATKIYSKKEF